MERAADLFTWERIHKTGEKDGKFLETMSFYDECQHLGNNKHLKIFLPVISYFFLGNLNWCLVSEEKWEDESWDCATSVCVTMVMRGVCSYSQSLQALLNTQGLLCFSLILDASMIAIQPLPWIVFQRWMVCGRMFQSLDLHPGDS